MSKKTTKFSFNQLKQKLEDYVTSNANESFTARQLQSRISASNKKKQIIDAAQQLLNANKIQMDEQGRYTYDSDKRKSRDRRESKKGKKDNVFEGKVDKTRSGAAFIVVEGLEKDIFVPPRRLGTALHHDTVLIKIFNLKKRKPEGEVLKVVSRYRDRFVGRLIKHKNQSIVETEDGKTHFDVKVHTHEVEQIKAGTIVVAKVEKWPQRKGQLPLGRVTTPLGKSGTNEIEMNSILIKNGFNLAFPDEVLEEAKAIPEEIPASEAEKRKDIRQFPTFTIDPATAKDFDDALSYRDLGEGKYEVGIHIADVTHYVKEGGAIDEEARERTTSVYLVDRVCPMLPEKLSNNLCSLRPHEDRCAFSAMFTFNSKHQIEKRWFGRTLIHSDQRFTYSEAQEVIDGKEHDLQDELRELDKVARRLRNKRFQQGSINFETDEIRFELDEEGRPLEIYVKERKEAHLLVEDLMLLANREVAGYINSKSESVGEIPFVYRVHDLPDPEKLQDFAFMAKEIGFDFNLSSSEAITESFNRLVEEARHDEALKILEPLAIRTMAKAVYDIENIGHYGLGFESYGHFTSPIRRYADVWVHRILAENLGNKTKKRDKTALSKHCKYISEVERSAQDAERESIKYKQVEFLKDQVGSIQPGYISGIIEKGFFVELEGSLAEGLVPFDSMQEPFSVEVRKYRATGERSGWVLKMGKRVRVKIVDVDLTRREIDMELVSMIEDE
jgi:ribonuclease R